MAALARRLTAQGCRSSHRNHSCLAGSLGHLAAAAQGAGGKTFFGIGIVLLIASLLGVTGVYSLVDGIHIPLLACLLLLLAFEKRCDTSRGASERFSPGGVKAQALEQRGEAEAGGLAAAVMNEFRETLLWYDALDPIFKFLLALPVLVAAAGLLGDWVRSRFGSKHVDEEN